ncbi:hypothetical protein ZIOFF_055362 [Zingiber officinale]|uniref:Uncharacterized protein n=1 Tax=Zingiber officinale TaxID=94328 RepID=A0A8J5KEI3_ZINOF|nr:hypothetical protein ZIOFF_055362 [Zingiber officinale]
MAQLRKAQKQAEITNEVDKYFSDPFVKWSSNFDILEWWKGNTTTFPVLSKIAKDIFSIPSSTVASENAFSLGRRVVDPFRASLHPKMVEALVCTSDWLRGEEINLYKEPTEDEFNFYKDCEEVVTIQVIEIEFSYLMKDARSWLLEEEEIHSDIATCAMAFRLLRLNGYDVSSDCLSRLGDVHYFSNTLQGHLKDVNTVLKLYKASQIKIYPYEQGLDKLASWSRMFLKEALITSQNLGHQIGLQEVDYDLKFSI